MSDASENSVKTRKSEVTLRRPMTWNGGTAMVVEEDTAFGAFSTTPRDHYVQIALSTAGGRHVFGWNGRHVFEGEYRNGLMNITPAGYNLHGECQAPWRRALIVKVKPKFLSQSAQEPGLARAEIAPVVGQVDGLVWHLAQAVAAECEAGVPNGSLYTETAMTLLTLHLLRLNAETASVNSKRLCGGSALLMRASSSTRLAKWQVARVIDKLHESLVEEPSLVDLAASVGLSAFHFARAFKVSTGMPPYRYFIRLRIVKARQLLEATNLPISEIAARVGYNDPGYFARLFRRQLGVTPAAYRRERRGEQLAA